MEISINISTLKNLQAEVKDGYISGNLPQWLIHIERCEILQATRIIRDQQRIGLLEARALVDLLVVTTIATKSLLV